VATRKTRLWRTRIRRSDFPARRRADFAGGCRAVHTEAEDRAAAPHWQLAVETPINAAECRESMGVKVTASGFQSEMAAQFAHWRSFSLICRRRKTRRATIGLGWLDDPRHLPIFALADPGGRDHRPSSYPLKSRTRSRSAIPASTCPARKWTCRP
jgi:hypothetical protein